MARKWTTQEELLIIKASKNKDNLRRSFQRLGEKIDRTPDAIVTRFYNKLNK